MVNVETKLVERLRNGDAAAVEPLMEQYARRVYSVAHGITRNAADAEEVVQDVFMNLFRKIDTFEGRALLGTWIYRITVNAALIKRRGKRLEVEGPLEDQFPTFLPDGHRAGDQSWLRADWSQRPDEELLAQETRTIVNGAIEGLPDDYRTVLIIRDVEGLSTEEAAEALGETVAAVKSRLHRARMVLREHLTRHLYPDKEESRRGA